MSLRGMESTKLVNGHTFHWCSKYTLSWWSATHSMVMHTDYSTTSKQNINAQVLEFDTTTWVINIPVHDMNLAFSTPPPPHMPRLQHLGQPQPSAMFPEPTGHQQ